MSSTAFRPLIGESLLLSRCTEVVLLLDLKFFYRAHLFTVTRNIRTRRDRDGNQIYFLTFHFLVLSKT